MKRRVSSVLALIVLAASVSGSAAAQTYMFKSVPGETPQIGVRYLRPDFKHGSEMSVFSGIYDFRADLPINARWSIDASVPWSRWSSDEEDVSDDYIGNIYAGMQYLRAEGDRTMVASFGAYLPTAEANLGHVLLGAITDNIGLFKYIPDAWTFYGNFAWFDLREGGVRLGFEAGPDLVVPTGDNDSDTEFFLHYGLIAGFRAEKFAATLELIGLMVVSEDYDDFGDRFVHALDLGVSYISPHLSPGVFYMIYLGNDENDWTSLVDGVLGVDVNFVF
jgi:hypothetical protein